jgi:hypothetical protein
MDTDRHERDGPKALDARAWSACLFGDLHRVASQHQHPEPIPSASAHLSAVYRHPRLVRAATGAGSSSSLICAATGAGSSRNTRHQRGMNLHTEEQRGGHRSA